ncbi:MAG TPA: hypothetical protein VFZ21_21525 [Gemmatimonadaceae bacterium]|nr:hypothetical protein [Gemmatimonadaceae bacterium]
MRSRLPIPSGRTSVADREHNFFTDIDRRTNAFPQVFGWEHGSGHGARRFEQLSQLTVLPLAVIAGLEVLRDDRPRLLI